jgi:hypothetical protein
MRFWIRKRPRAEKRGGRREKAKGFQTTDQSDLTDGILFIGRSGKLNAKTRETQRRKKKEDLNRRTQRKRRSGKTLPKKMQSFLTWHYGAIYSILK